MPKHKARKRLRKVYYIGADGQHYWRLVARNGRIRCQGEGHPSRSNARRALDTLIEDIRADDVELVEVRL